MSVVILGISYPLNTAAQIHEAASALRAAAPRVIRHYAPLQKITRPIGLTKMVPSSTTILDRAQRVLAEQDTLREQVATVSRQLLDADIRLTKLERTNGR